MDFWVALEQGEATMVEVRALSPLPSRSAIRGRFRTQHSLPRYSLYRLSSGSRPACDEPVVTTGVAVPERFSNGALRASADRAQAPDHYPELRVDRPGRRACTGGYRRTLVPRTRRARCSWVNSGNEPPARVWQCLATQRESREWASPGESRGLQAAFHRLNGPGARRSQFGQLCWPRGCGPRDELTGHGSAA